MGVYAMCVCVLMSANCVWFKLGWAMFERADISTLASLNVHQFQALPESRLQIIAWHLPSRERGINAK